MEQSKSSNGLDDEQFEQPKVNKGNILTVEKYINDNGKECYRNVSEDTKFSSLQFHKVDHVYDTDIQFALHTNLGSLTVLDRMTGFGWRDIETGYHSKDGKFWLASGRYDVRECGADTISEAIEWVKKNANSCIGI